MVPENHIDLSIAREQMLQHILQLEDLAALQERKRIAREIHDSLGNALTTLNVQLQTAHKLWNIDPTLAKKFLTEAQRLGAIAIQEVRQSVSSMREIVPLEQPLTDLIDSLVQNFYQVTGILPSTKIDLPVHLSPEVVKTLYRIIQEAFTNICKYAEATKVEINLSHTSHNLSLIIQDNGKGFKLSQNKTGFGLQGMQERVSALKGNFNIDTEPGYGCWIVVNLPLEQQAICRQASSEEDFNLEIADTTPILEASTRDFSLEIADTTPIVETSTKDCSLQTADTTRLEELSALEFNLKLLDITLLQETSTRNSNLKLLDTTPIAETSAQDSNLKLLDTTPIAETDQQRLFLSKKTTAETESHPDKSLCENDFISQIVHNLAELIGPIAYYLVQKLLQSSPTISHLELIKTVAGEISDSKKAMTAFNYQQVIDKLSVHLAPHEQIAFEQESSFLTSESLSQSQVKSTLENVPINSPGTDDEAISESFLHQCEQDLAEFIGPIAIFLVQKAVKSSLKVSRAELIKMLAAEIADPNKAEQFQQHLLS
ncbi:MAG: sensor histidine kinase [Aulosira sp. DedQUE10]|nr:sensor histidine kinase [Aulosira sp. DedQUE10]